MTGRVAILGGGVAGLVAAYRLRQAFPSLDDLAITLVERKDRLGGSIGTERHEGFLIESGVDSFFTTKASAVELSRKLGLGERLQGIAHRRVYVARRGRLVPFPDGLVLLTTPRLGPMIRSPLLSIRGKARVALEPILPARRERGDESLASFVRRRLGREALERIADPLVAGIHAGDPERLSMSSLLPQFLTYEREHGSVLRGLRAAARSRPPRDPTLPAGPFATFRNGMSELVDALVTQTPGVEYKLATKALAVERGTHGGFEIPLDDGSVLRAETVLMATPAPVSAQLLEGLEPKLAETLRAIPYASSAVVSLAFPADACRPLDGSGFLVPRTEGVHLKACTWVSSKFEGRAPHGHILLRSFYGGVREASVLDRSDNPLAELAVQELTPLLGLRGRPEFARVHRWPRAHPQYEVHHAERVAAIESARAAVPGLFLAGSAYHGIGIPDCIEDADRAARGVSSFLSTERVLSREAAA
jgi:oxygen-dependent protoporphyrinogen oxidase